MDIIQPLQKNDYMIVKLIITDQNGVPIQKPFRLKVGQNVFKCKALYNDGSEQFFSPYWTCPILYNNGGYDVWSVFGNQKQEAVTINATTDHESYTELACWAFPPKNESPTGNSEIPRDSTGFDYSKVI
jgi:hypothetical protein